MFSFAEFISFIGKDEISSSMEINLVILYDFVCFVKVDFFRWPRWIASSTEMDLVVKMLTYLCWWGYLSLLVDMVMKWTFIPADSVNWSHIGQACDTFYCLQDPIKVFKENNFCFTSKCYEFSFLPNIFILNFWLLEFEFRI